MIDLPDNWEQLESEHNKHYDPYDCAKSCANGLCDSPVYDDDEIIARTVYE